MTTSSMKDTALELAGRGWHLIPLWGVTDRSPFSPVGCACPKGTDCDSPGKHPLARLVPQGLKQASADRAAVADWWDAEPAANIGVVAGPSNLLIIDIDGVQGLKTFDLLTERYGGSDAAATYVVTTGREGGLHLYFTLPEGTDLGRRSNTPLGEHLDTRHGAGYVVAQGSLHASGRRYEPVRGEGPQEAPLWLLSALADAKPASRLADVAGSAEPFQVLHGQGNTWLTSMAGTLVARGVSGTALYAALWAMNTEHMRDAPMAPDAVRKIAESIGRHPADAEAVMRALDPTGADMTGLIESVEVAAEPDEGERLAAPADYTQATIDVIMRAGATDEDYADIVEALAGAGGVLWVQGMGWAAWDGQRWHLDAHGAGETVIRDWLRDAALILRTVHGKGRDAAIGKAKRLSGERARRPGLARLALRRHLRVQPDDFDTTDTLVGLPDGRLLELEAGGGHHVRAATRADRVTRHLADTVVYEPNATCPLWEAFLARVLPDAELRSYLQRWCGYLLTGYTTEQCFAVLIGAGSNGKSTVVDTIMAVLGLTKTSGYGHSLLQGAVVSSAGTAGEQSSIAQLRGARFASAIEPKKGGALNEELVKQATGDETLTAKFMGRDPFTFHNRAKLFIATNHPPAVEGTDEGIWRRIRRIPFTEIIGPAERDNDLKYKLRGGGGGDRDGELAGILNWMLAGYEAWAVRGLATPGAVEAETEAYRRAEDTFGAFLADTYEIDPRGPATSGWYVRTAAVAETAEAWLRANDPAHHGLSAKAIGGELGRLGVGVRQIREADGKRTRVYVGLRALPGLRRLAGEDGEPPSADAVLDGAA